MRKTILALLAALLAICALSWAGAEGSERHLRMKRYPIWSNDLRGGNSTLVGPTNCVTGTTYTWTLEANEGVGSHFDVAVTISDKTYANPYICDTLYDVELSRGVNTFSYTFYQPGSYVFFVDYLDNTSLGSDNFRITVTDGGPNALTEKVAQVVDDCQAQGDEWQTAFNLYRWLMDNAVYDLTYTYYSPEAVLLDRADGATPTGVCNSFARAYVLLLQKAGIEARRQVGKGGSENHAWTVVKLDGKWYQMDPTWSKTHVLTNSGEEWRENMTYFGLSDALMFLDHTAENTQGGSVTCDSLDANYYLHSEDWEVLALGLNPGPSSALATAGGSATMRITGNLCMREGDRIYQYSMDSRNRTFVGTVLAALFNTWNWKEQHTVGRAFNYTFDQSAGVIRAVRDSTAQYLPASLTEVGEEAFAGSAVTYIVIPATCTEIGARAFADSALWKIVIPASVTAIDPTAFKGVGELVIVTTEGSAAQQLADSDPDDNITWQAAS